MQVFLDDIFAEESSDVTMMCHVSGHPLPQIIWSKSEESLPASRSIINGGNLTIQNVNTNDSGSYVCTTTSIVGSSSSSVKLQVYSVLKFLTRPSSFVVVYTGQTLNLSCSASSNPSPTVTWVFNGNTSLPEGAATDASHNLIIVSANITHGGNCTCSAMNSLSSLHAHVTIHVKIPETCSKVKANISDVSGDYVIDPDGEQGEAPFTVYCNMTEKGIEVTAFSHDSGHRTHVVRFEVEGSYSRDIRYTGTTLSQIKGLLAVSTYCQQFIRYECKASLLLYKYDVNGWWVSRDGEKMRYWGGATEGCACGMTNSCADPRKLCNFDKNDYVWREDSGVLTNKAHLPVSQLRFGDTGGAGAEGYHTLGKLECYGLN